MMQLSEKEQILAKKQALDIAIEEIILEHKLQDSLHNAGLLSKNEYDYRRFNLVGLVKNNFLQDSAFIQHSDIEKIFADTDLTAEKYAKYVSLQQLQQYQRELNAKVTNHIKDIKPIAVGDGIGSGGSRMNYIARFDTISNLGFLSAKSKQSFLSHELKGIFANENINNIEKYSEKYIFITDDALYVNKLLAENKMDLSKKDELLLIDRNNNQTNFQEVLAKRKGKVIYLDFWASWCAPCLHSMPEARKLREEYKNKDVVFIYLAFNDQEERWKEAEQKHEVGYLSESYFITNSKTAKIITELNVGTIPRYLLFDKNGDLAHPKAPGPAGREIREQLDNLLK
jgi:thiol-disulfide isomerase/thioredoxin